MRVLVTGGAGFIGSNLCRELTSRQVDGVTVIDDLSTGSTANLDGLEVELVEASILDEEALDAVCARVDSVVHLAAIPSVPRSIKDPRATHDANATGTLAVLEAARRHRLHVSVASSSSVYGANEILPKSEGLVPMPVSPYAVSKLATEQYAFAYQHSFSLSTIAFRFFNVFGPGQAPDHAYAAVIPSFVWNALKGQPVVVHGDGGQTRDFTYIQTVTSVLADAAVQQLTHDGPINLALGSRVSLLEILGLLEEILERGIEREFVSPRVGDVRDSQADSSLVKELFPSASPTPLVEGLAATVLWMTELVATVASTDA